jgi:hypothetical protein
MRARIGHIYEHHNRQQAHCNTCLQAEHKVEKAAQLRSCHPFPRLHWLHAVTLPGNHADMRTPNALAGVHQCEDLIGALGWAALEWIAMSVPSRTWKQVASASAKSAMAIQACRPKGCGRPCPAAQATSTAPAGSSRTATTHSGAVCGASTCAHMGAHARQIRHLWSLTEQHLWRPDLQAMLTGASGCSCPELCCDNLVDLHPERYAHMLCRHALYHGALHACSCLPGRRMTGALRKACAPSWPPWTCPRRRRAR